MSAATATATTAAAGGEPDAGSPSVIKWKRPPTFGAPPSGRGGHSAVIVGNLMIVYGGTFYAGSNKFQYLADTWALDLDAMKWHKPACTGRAPGARYAHAAAVVDYKMYIFGGKGDGGILYNDLWCLDAETWTWSLVPSSSAAPPRPRFGHSMNAINGRLLVFGGWDGHTCNNELWTFDTTGFNWQRTPTSGVSPSARHGHSCMYDETGKRLLVFGGWQNDADGAPVYQKDVRQLDLMAMAWSRPRIGGEIPGGRYWHGCVGLGNVMITVGGWDGPREGLTANAGAEVVSNPAASAEEAMISIPYTAGMGSGDATAAPGRMITVPFGVHTDTYFLDLDIMEWLQPQIAGKAPGYRYGMTACVAGAQVLLFGGWEGSRVINELVVLDMSELVADGGEPAAADAEAGGDYDAAASAQDARAGYGGEYGGGAYGGGAYGGEYASTDGDVVSARDAADSADADAAYDADAGGADAEWRGGR